MTYQYTISDIGLRLIKAYEGFFAEPVKLDGEHYLIGFGHRLSLGDDLATIDEAQAESLLEQDLAPVQALVNRYVHSGMTQSQFDALCSLVFTIGDKAFLESSILHDLNQGKIIEAANGFDAWRYGRVAGRTYMVDALVRRRTAEKALFLRPTVKTPAAARYDLTPMREGEQVSHYPAPWTSLGTNAGTEPEAENSLNAADEAISARQLQASKGASLYADDDTTTDPNADTLLLTETVDIVSLVDTPPKTFEQESYVVDDLSELDEIAAKLRDNDLDTPSELGAAEPLHHAEIHSDVSIDGDRDAPSPIAEAAAEVSERLDALMGRTDTANKVQDLDQNDKQDWPSSLIDTDKTASSPSDRSKNNVVELHSHQNANQKPPDIIIDELELDDAMRSLKGGVSSNYYYAEGGASSDNKQNNALWAYIVMIVIGATLTVGGTWLNLQGSSEILGKYGPFVSVSSVTLGVLLFLMGMYYLLKALFGR